MKISKHEWNVWSIFICSPSQNAYHGLAEGNIYKETRDCRFNMVFSVFLPEYVPLNEFWGLCVPLSCQPHQPCLGVLTHGKHFFEIIWVSYSHDNIYTHNTHLLLHKMHTVWFMFLYFSIIPSYTMYIYSFTCVYLHLRSAELDGLSRTALIELDVVAMNSMARTEARRRAQSLIGQLQL